MCAPLPPVLARRVAEGRFDLQFAELATLGISQGQLRRWIREGHLLALGAGAYVIVAPTPDVDLFEQKRLHYLRRCAATIASIPHAYLVGPSAAVAHALPLLTLPTDVHLARRPHARLTRRGVRAHRPWGAEPILLSGVPCQDPASVVVDVSAHYGVESGLMVGDAAAHRGLCQPATVSAAVAQYGTREGVVAARRVGELVDPRIESPGETRLRWILLQAGLELIPQVEIFTPQGQFVARVDFLVAGTRVILEFDGMGKYTSRATFSEEKRRQLALERLGHTVCRFIWADLQRPARVVDLVVEAVARQRGY